jgi:hypothetical protein
MTVLTKAPFINGNLIGSGRMGANLGRTNTLRIPRVLEREIIRYGAYFKGWCAAFGEHEPVHPNTQHDIWLLGENKIGLLLTKPELKRVYQEVLLHRIMPSLAFSRQGAQIGGLHFSFDKDNETQIRTAIEQLFDSQDDLHMFLTSHLIYGSDRRIITISSKKPLSIIYKQIGTLKIAFR